MTLPFYYSVGTASVANGETTVTFTGALLGTEDSPNIQPGDIFLDPAQSDGFQRRIASVDYDAGTAELASAWLGTTMSDAAYRVDFVGDFVRSTAQTRRLLEQMSVVEANGRGLFFRFDDGTEDSDPGAGRWRFDDADPAAATLAIFDNLDANGASVSALIDTWDDTGGETDRGQVWVRSISTPATLRAYKVSGSVVDGTGYRKLTIEHIGGSGSFASDDEGMAYFVPAGVQGAAFAFDAETDDPDGLTAHEGEADGYRVFVLDLGGTEFGSYSGRSGVVEWNGSDTWTLISLYTGPKGNQGAKGDKGWAPQLVGETDGTRRVLKLSGYVGGEGDAPTANVGEYLKADGTFTATIGDAMDIRGAAGANGSGTVADVIAGTGIDVDATDPTQPVVRVEQAVLDDIDTKITMGKAVAAAIVFG